jgi:anti-repressor protein
MNDLTLFEYSGTAVRVVMIDGEPWFVAADVCRVLEHTNPSVAVRMLEVEDVRVLPRSEALNFGLATTDLRAQFLNVISEPGLYTLIMRSNVPAAKPFRRWVTSEVLPSIRKTGQYAVAEPAPALPSYTEALRQLADSLDAQESQRQELAAAAPKVDFFDRYVDAAGNYKIGDVAKVLAIPGLGQNRLFQILREEAVLISGGRSHNAPFQRHVNVGRFVVKVTSYDKPDGSAGTSMTTYATAKGLDYIRKVVASMGFVAPNGGGVAVS